MSRYQVMLSPDLDETYQMMAEDLEMSMEQVLSSAVQIYAERVHDYVEKSREEFTACQTKAERK